MQWEVDNPPLKEESREGSSEKAVKAEDNKSETVGDNTDRPEAPGPDILPATNGHDHLTTNEPGKSEVSGATDHHGAEGEEMVEGEEDTVIY